MRRLKYHNSLYPPFLEDGLLRFYHYFVNLSRCFSSIRLLRIWIRVLLIVGKEMIYPVRIQWIKKNDNATESIVAQRFQEPSRFVVFFEAIRIMQIFTIASIAWNIYTPIPRRFKCYDDAYGFTQDSAHPCMVTQFPEISLHSLINFFCTQNRKGVRVHLRMDLQ